MARVHLLILSSFLWFTKGDYPYLRADRKYFKKFTDEADTHLVARIVFGEARGETEEGQLAVAYSVVNRMNLPGYPNTIYKVVYQRCGNKHQFETLDVKGHDEAWKDAVARNTDEYQNAIRAATDALLGKRPDPTLGATDFSIRDPDPATSDNELYEASGKIQIGDHYFVCKRPKSS